MLYPEQNCPDFRSKGYSLYNSGGMASHVNLSREAIYFQKIAREMANRSGSNPSVEKILSDIRNDAVEGKSDHNQEVRQGVEKQIREGKCDWATRKPIY
jgi:hypothetical protein